jgi:hypothetical protein
VGAAVSLIPWHKHVGPQEHAYRVTMTRLHRRTPSAEPWAERLTRFVTAISPSEAMQSVEQDVLCDGDDCYGLNAERVT